MLHGGQAESIEGHSCGLLLGVLLRPPDARPDLLTVDERCALESAVVGWPVGPERDVLDPLAALRELLLKRRLLVDRLGQRLLDPGLERLHHGAGELVQTPLEV